MPNNPGDATEAQQTLLREYNENQPSTETIFKLVKRLRLLTLQLLPVQVLESDLTEVTSRIVTPEVISAYKDAAGDFVEALPYCLLRARQEFVWEANQNPADYDENYGRALACEVLARRIVHQTPRDRLAYMMSNRYQSIWDGDETNLVSALELAVDSHCTVFLSSNESQDVVNSLWCGDLVIRRKHNRHIDFMPYRETSRYGKGFFDASRLSVPRYQNLFRIFVWLCFLVLYSQAVREPLDRMNPRHSSLDPTEIAMYVLALSFAFEDLHKLYKLLRFVNFRSFTFWLIVSGVTDILFMVAFSLRMYGLGANSEQDTWLRLKAFQVLSFVSPLIWMKLITIFDGYKYVGTMQICIARMLRESGIFFALLSILGAGFAQGLYALDASDEDAQSPWKMIHLLIQALLQSPNYESFSENPAGLSLYYLWNVATAVILLNVLVSLFSSAYDDVVEDAEAEYLAFFASKTVEMIRAPDSYVYPAPGNIIETLLVAPFELVLSPNAYAKLNRVAMSVVYFIPLVAVSFYESVFRSNKNSWLKAWFHSEDEGDDDTPENRNPHVSEPQGLQIVKTKFEDLTRAFPDTTLSSEATLKQEIRGLREQLDMVLRRLDQMSGEQDDKGRKGRKKSRSSSSRAAS